MLPTHKIMCRTRDVCGSRNTHSVRSRISGCRYFYNFSSFPRRRVTSEIIMRSACSYHSAVVRSQIHNAFSVHLTAWRDPIDQNNPMCLASGRREHALPPTRIGLRVRCEPGTRYQSADEYAMFTTHAVADGCLGRPQAIIVLPKARPCVLRLRAMHVS